VVCEHDVGPTSWARRWANVVGKTLFHVSFWRRINVACQPFSDAYRNVDSTLAQLRSARRDSHIRFTRHVTSQSLYGHKVLNIISIIFTTGYPLGPRKSCNLEVICITDWISNLRRKVFVPDFCGELRKIWTNFEYIFWADRLHDREEMRVKSKIRDFIQ